MGLRARWWAARGICALESKGPVGHTSLMSMPIIQFVACYTLATLVIGCASISDRGMDASAHSDPARMGSTQNSHQPEAAGPNAAREVVATGIDPITGYAIRSTQTGTASWYGPGFHGRQTANGETFDQDAMTAAHLSLPFDTLVRVTRLDTGQSILLRINDRGPYIDDRIIDLSRAGARELGFLSDGLAEVRVDDLGPARAEERAARSRIRRGAGGSSDFESK